MEFQGFAQKNETASHFRYLCKAGTATIQQFVNLRAICPTFRKKQAWHSHHRTPNPSTLLPKSWYVFADWRGNLRRGTAVNTARVVPGVADSGTWFRFGGW